MAISKRELQLVVTAKDDTSKGFKKLGNSFTDLKNKTISLGSAAKTAALGLGAAAGGLAFVIKNTTDASNELNNALIGLNSVSVAFGQNADDAKKAAVDLASDGLLSVKSAADSLKNLLATGFQLPEAIKLMEGFKDAAAFNRQGTLEFGVAIEGATQGLKNQNSIMVDNAGITKNLSIILKEAGFSAQDLGEVTSNVAVRTALYNGILKEAAIFQGDAAKMASTLSGEQAALATQIFTVKAAIGEALQPVMLEIIKSIRQMIDAVGGPAGIQKKFMEYRETILSITELMIAMIQVIFAAVDAWFKFVDVMEKVINTVMKAVNAIKELASSTASTVGTSFRNLPSNLGFGGARAKGGAVSTGKSFLVGEKGPELFSPSSNGSITPNNKLGGGGGVNITINGDVTGDEIVQKVSDAIMGELLLNNKVTL